MKRIWYILLVLSYSLVRGQDIQMISQGDRPDSSFYHIEKISDNEYWIGGEYGILKAVDTLGFVRNINYPSEGIDLIKIKKVDHFIYLLSANAIIYRYDILTEKFIKKRFTKFHNRCFYDMVILDDNRLVVCGGTSGIAEGKKKIPRGFIATIDRDLNEIKVVWKHMWQFVWSLSVDSDHSIIAATFNGRRSKIITSKDLKRWNKSYQVKGLIHELRWINGEMWYCGAKNVYFKKHGLLGNFNTERERRVLKDYGCLWSIEPYKDDLLGVTYSGDLLKMDKKGEMSVLTIPHTFSLYDLRRMTATKLLVVGRGKTAFILTSTL